jgi:chemotaxis protein histidine kinase CheA
MAILTRVKNGPAALAVDRIIQRQKVLIWSSNDNKNHHSIYQGTAALGDNRPISVLNVKNLEMVL